MFTGTPLTKFRKKYIFYALCKKAEKCLINFFKKKPNFFYRGNPASRFLVTQLCTAACEDVRENVLIFFEICLMNFNKGNTCTLIGAKTPSRSSLQSCNVL
jgi:hypothetical protein